MAIDANLTNRNPTAVAFADPSANPVAVSAANPMPVVVSGAGSAVTIADGADVTLGAKADAKSTATDTTPITAMQVLKQISFSAQAAAASVAGTLTVASHAVTNAGTFAVQATQSGTWNIGSITTLPALVAGSAIIGRVGIDQTTPGTTNLVSAAQSGTWNITNAGTFAVQAAQSGTWNVTNVSGTVSLPTGASTAAKQPALGTAGTASADVISIQGIASMTAVKVDGSAVTQPVSIATAPALVASTATIGGTFGFATTCTTTVTRPSDTNAYTANDCWSDSTSAPTSGGFTFTSAARISGGSGIITDVTIISTNDPATLLQGELWIFDSAGTNVNDNAAYALSDADAVKLVGVIAFTMLTTVGGSGTNSYYQSSNLNIGFTCSGTANLRFLVKVKNAYTPASAEQLTLRLKVVQTN